MLPAGRKEVSIVDAAAATGGNGPVTPAVPVAAAVKRRPAGQRVGHGQPGSVAGTGVVNDDRVNRCSWPGMAVPTVPVLVPLKLSELEMLEVGRNKQVVGIGGRWRGPLAVSVKPAGGVTVAVAETLPVAFAATGGRDLVCDHAAGGQVDRWYR